MQNYIGQVHRLNRPPQVGYSNESVCRLGRDHPDAVQIGLQTPIFRHEDELFVTAYGHDSCVDGYIKFGGLDEERQLTPIPPGTFGPAVGEPALFGVVARYGDRLCYHSGPCSEIARVVARPAFAETRAELRKFHPREDHALQHFMFVDMPMFAEFNPKLFVLRPEDFGPTCHGMKN